MSPFDAALPSTEDLFSVIEAIHDNVAIVDHNGVMRWVSRSLVCIFHFPGLH